MRLGNEICLAWLEGALRQLRAEGQTKVVGYLEAVLDEVVLEMEGGPSVVTYIVPSSAKGA